MYYASVLSLPRESMVIFQCLKSTNFRLVFTIDSIICHAFLCRVSVIQVKDLLTVSFSACSLPKSVNNSYMLSCAIAVGKRS